MLNSKKSKRFSFMPTYKTIREIMIDQNLASLGDAYINLIYSLYLSTKTREPTGTKVDSRMLSNALRRAGLRRFLPSRIDRHKQADAAEALLVYVWLQGLTAIKEAVSIMMKYEDYTEAFSSLLSDAKKKLGYKP